jgi:hypothetical protein
MSNTERTGVRCSDSTALGYQRISADIDRLVRGKKWPLARREGDIASTKYGDSRASTAHGRRLADGPVADPALRLRRRRLWHQLRLSGPSPGV